MLVPAVPVRAAYLRAARAHWPVVAACALLGGAALGLAAARERPTYRADVQLTVVFVPAGEAALRPADPAGEQRASAHAERGRQLRQRRVKTYAAMVAAPRVTAPVAGAVRPPYPPDELSHRLRASSPLGRDTIDVSVVDTDPRRAERIAGAVAAELGRIAARERPSPDLPVTTRVLVTDPPGPATGPHRGRWQLAAAAGALGGAGVGTGVATARQRGTVPFGRPLRLRWPLRRPPRWPRRRGRRH